MKQRKRIWTISGMVAACCVCLLMVFAVGCKDEKAKKPAPAPTPPKKQPSTATAPKPQAAAFVNVNCPIMSKNVIDPAKVTANLTRTHKGQKVAFCCAACPTAWDKLSDTERDAKLAKVMRAKGD